MALPIASVVAGSLIDPTTFGNAVVDAINAAPRGHVGTVSLTSPHGPITAITDVSYGGAPLSVTWNAVASRRYRTTFTGEVRGTVAGDVIVVWITDGSNNGIKRHVVEIPPLYSGTGYVGVTFSTSPETGLSGSVTRKIRAERDAGTGTLTMWAQPTSPMAITVEDIGT